MYQHIKHTLKVTSLAVALLGASFTVQAEEVEENDATLYCEALNYMRVSFAFDTTSECVDSEFEVSDTERFQNLLEGLEAVAQAELDYIVEEQFSFVEMGVLPYPFPSIFNSRTAFNVDRNFESALFYAEQDFLGLVDDAVITESVKETRISYSARKSDAERVLGFK